MATDMLLVKLLTTIALVLGLSWVAERVDTRVAGILSGMPLGSLLVLFFVGQELGPVFTRESALYAIPALTGTLVFAGVYYLASRHDHILGPLIATSAALPCYLLIAVAMSQITFTLGTGIVVTCLAIVLSIRLFDHIPDQKVEKRVRLTIRHLLFRAGAAAFFVAAITGIARSVGPRWSGLLIGFPITFLPFLLIIHLTYSRQHAHTIIRNFPIGLGGLIAYLSLVYLAIPAVGVNLSIVTGLSGSLVYLIIISYLLRRRRRLAA